MPIDALASFLGTTSKHSDSPPQDGLVNTFRTTICDSDWTGRPHRTLAHRFRVAPLPRPKERFIAEQKWKGIVLEIGEESFVARLENLTERTIDERAEFDLDVLDDVDLPMVAVGAVFYWSIGNLDTTSGRKRTSQLRFARLPGWTPEELGIARRRAKELAEAIAWDDTDE